jgi:hypothetical protein
MTRYKVADDLPKSRLGAGGHDAFTVIEGTATPVHVVQP